MKKLLLISNSGGNSPLSTYLSGLGYTISSIVRSAEQAIEKVRKNSPDIIVMDYDTAQQIDGRSIYAKIRQQEIEIPIIYMTAPNA